MSASDVGRSTAYRANNLVLQRLTTDVAPSVWFRGKTMATDAVKSIRRALDRGRLADALTEASRLARVHDQRELARWARLEVGGYYPSNPEMDDDVVVPPYRTVSGQHHDVYGRVFVPPANVAFVNEIRLRDGVRDLDRLIRDRHEVTIHDAHTVGLIREYFSVDVYSFTFSTYAVECVLSSIRAELEERLERALSALTPGPRELTEAPPPASEVIQLRPNLYGMESTSAPSGAAFGVTDRRIKPASTSGTCAPRTCLSRPAAFRPPSAAAGPPTPTGTIVSRRCRRARGRPRT